MAPVQPVGKLQKTSTDAFTYAEDSQLSLNLAGQTHTIYPIFSVGCCLMLSYAPQNGHTIQKHPCIPMPSADRTGRHLSSD